MAALAKLHNVRMLTRCPFRMCMCVQAHRCKTVQNGCSPFGTHSGKFAHSTSLCKCPSAMCSEAKDPFWFRYVSMFIGRTWTERVEREVLIVSWEVRFIFRSGIKKVNHSFCGEFHLLYHFPPVQPVGLFVLTNFVRLNVESFALHLISVGFLGNITSGLQACSSVF